LIGGKQLCPFFHGLGGNSTLFWQRPGDRYYHPCTSRRVVPQVQNPARGGSQQQAFPDLLHRYPSRFTLFASLVACY
jgi:hypothetical protein